MPAAAVIPAPIAYIKVAAVKKLVVELHEQQVAYHLLSTSLSTVTVRKLECFKQAIAGIH